jgi:hypothetical protein
VARRIDRPVVLPELNPHGDLVLCRRGGGYGHQWDDAPWPEFLNYEAFDIGYPMSERCSRCKSYLICTYTPRMDILNRYYYHSLEYKAVLADKLDTTDVRTHRVARSKHMEQRLKSRVAS